MQPPVLRIDVQYPLPGNAHPFRRHGDEREDKALEPALHVNAGEDSADLAQQVQVEVLQHGGEEQEHRVVLHCGKGRCAHPKSLFCTSKFFSEAPRWLYLSMTCSSVLSWSLVSMARYTYSIPGKSCSPCPVSILARCTTSLRCQSERKSVNAKDATSMSCPLTAVCRHSSHSSYIFLRSTQLEARR